MHADDNRIREKAYELWRAAGSPEGEHLAHWEQAKAAAEKDEAGTGQPAGADKEMPVAGPHAKPELTNRDATPGSGMFAEPGDEDDANAQPSS